MATEVKKVKEVKPLTSKELEEQVNDICGLVDAVEQALTEEDILEQVMEQATPEAQASFEELASEMSQPIPEVTPHEGAKASQFLKNFMEKIASQEFDRECEEVGKNLNLPKQVVAKNFILRCFGVIGDCLGIAIETGRGFVQGLIHIVAWVLTQGVNVICDVAHGLARFITFNQTAKA